MSKIYMLMVYFLDLVHSQECRFQVLESSRHIGCFVDTHTRLLPREEVFAPMDNDRCILKCRKSGYMYAGTEASAHCFCGNNPWKYNADDVDPMYVGTYSCNFPCTGNSTQMCGGFWRLSVYSTSLR